MSQWHGPLGLLPFPAACHRPRPPSCPFTAAECPLGFQEAKALFLENSMKECTARSSKTIGFFKSLFLRTSNFPIEILKTRFAYVLTGDRLRGLLLAQREALQQSSATHGESAVQSTPLPPGFLPPHPSPLTAKLEDKLQASLSASPFRYLIESGNVVLSLFFFFSFLHLLDLK